MLNSYGLPIKIGVNSWGSGMIFDKEDFQGFDKIGKRGDPLGSN